MKTSKILQIFILIYHINFESPSTHNYYTTTQINNDNYKSKINEEMRKTLSIVEIPSIFDNRSFSTEFRIALQVISTLFYIKHTTKIKFRRKLHLNDTSLQFSGSLADILHYFKETGYCYKLKRKAYYDIMLSDPYSVIYQCIEFVKINELKELKYFNDLIYNSYNFIGNVLLYKKEQKNIKMKKDGKWFNILSGYKYTLLNLVLIDLYIETEWFKSYNAYFLNGANKIEVYSFVVSQNTKVQQLIFPNFHYKWYFVK